MDAKGVYRNPPWLLGPEVYMASDIERIDDWPSRAIGIEQVLSRARGKGVRVGVCDTGRSVHGDVADRIVHSGNFSSSYSDQDFQGHGTHCAGIIGSTRLGLAPECELVTAKVLGDDGSGDSQAVARGVEFCLEKGCHVISMSLGGGYDERIHHAIARAVAAGVYVIVAAGNDGYVRGRNTVGFPARLDETIAIASYNKNGQLSQFSSRGREVDFAFPGEEILSNWLDNKYRRLSGTSMATPFAAALAACWRSFAEAQKKAGARVREIRSNEELRDRWIECSIDKGPTGQDEGWGYGVVDANKFLQSEIVPTTPPPAVIQPAPVPSPAPAPVPLPDEQRFLDLLNVFGLPNTLVLKGPVKLGEDTGYFLYSPRG